MFNCGKFHFKLCIFKIGHSGALIHPKAPRWMNLSIIQLTSESELYVGWDVHFGWMNRDHELLIRV